MFVNLKVSKIMKYIKKGDEVILFNKRIFTDFKIFGH